MSKEQNLSCWPIRVLTTKHLPFRVQIYTHTPALFTGVPLLSPAVLALPLVFWF